MIALLMIGEELKAPPLLNKLLDGQKVQPVEIGYLLETEDLPELKDYLASIDADKIYVLCNTDCQAIKVLKESDLEIDVWFITYS